jgi:hypothetical protein
MKKITIYTMALLMMGIGKLNSGCIGSWWLTSKIYNWNDGATGNKFIDNLLFWILGFVYMFTITIDFAIFNLLEFWTGSNPLAMNEGDIETAIVKGKDGNQYQMTVTKNRYEAVALTGERKGEKSALSYNPATKTWSMEKGTTVTPFATIHPELNKVEVFGPNGEVQMLDMAAVATQGMFAGHQ